MVRFNVAQFAVLINSFKGIIVIKNFYKECFTIVRRCFFREPGEFRKIRPFAMKTAGLTGCL
jgi:hypothetical protein